MRSKTEEKVPDKSRLLAFCVLPIKIVNFRENMRFCINIQPEIRPFGNTVVLTILVSWRHLRESIRCL